MRATACKKAGNYNELAIGLGADDYSLWYGLHKTGAKFVRDDAVRNVVYRIHEKNSLKIRKARYGPQAPSKLPAGLAAAASLALFVGTGAEAAPPSPEIPAAQSTPNTEVTRQRIAANNFDKKPANPMEFDPQAAKVAPPEQFPKHIGDLPPPQS